MSIWASQFTLDSGHPLGPPFAVDYPPVDAPAPEAWVDVATAEHYADGLGAGCDVVEDHESHRSHGDAQPRPVLERPAPLDGSLSGESMEP
jgi:hypothetical protein